METQLKIRKKSYKNILNSGNYSQLFWNHKQILPQTLEFDWKRCNRLSPIRLNSELGVPSIFRMISLVCSSSRFPLTTWHRFSHHVWLILVKFSVINHSQTRVNTSLSDPLHGWQCDCYVIIQNIVKGLHKWHTSVIESGKLPDWRIIITLFIDHFQNSIFGRKQ